jgi:hypothetical protein
MKTALHILRKDLRRFAPGIGIYVLVILFGYAVALSNLDAARTVPGIGRDIVKLFQQAPLARWIVVGLLAAWAIHEDRSVGDRTAWMTRPIRPGDLVMAKAGFLATALALPAAILGAAVALWLRAPPGEVAAVAATDFIFTLFAAGVFAGVAVLTRNVAQTVMLGTGIFGTIAVTAFLLFEVARIQLPDQPSGLRAPSSFLVIAAGFLGSALAVLAHQYATRRTLRTAAIGAALALPAYFIGRYWPWNFWPDTRETAAVAPTPPGGLRLAMGSPLLDFRTRENAFGQGEGSLMMQLHLDNVPAGRMFVIGDMASSLSLDDGRTVVPSDPLKGGPQFGVDAAATAALGLAPAKDRRHDAYNAVFQCPGGLFRSLQGRSGRLEGVASAYERIFEVVVTLPVKPGAESIADGHLARITSTRLTAGLWTVGFQFAQVSPVLGVQPLNYPDVSLLINARRGEYSASEGGSTYGTAGPEMLFRGQYLYFATTQSAKTGMPTGKVDADWLAGASYFYLRPKAVGAAGVHLKLVANAITVPTHSIRRHFIVINPDGSRDEFDR